MSAIDGILGTMIRLEADELRLGTNLPPRVYAKGVQKRLAIDSTSDAELRHLLDGILTPEREEQMLRGGQVEVSYESAEYGVFHVTIAARSLGPSSSTLGSNSAGQGSSGFGLPGQGFDVFLHVGGLRSDGRPQSAPVMIPAKPVEVSGFDRPEEPTMPSRAGVSMLAVRPLSRTARLAELLARACRVRASDVHLQQGEPPTVRVDGRLRVMADEGPVDVRTMLEGVVPAAAIEKARRGLAGDVALELPELGRFRLNVYLTSAGLCAAIRLLPVAVPDLERLGMPLPLEELVDFPHGLVLVCGPTGSGKSTTLAALAQAALARRSIVLITLEDPIEYVLRAPPNGSLVRQRQVGRDVPDFPSGLRDALREDPDLIVIGEMRDPESIGLTLTAAETGHLVLASMHSRSAVSAIERAIDTYPPERQQQVRVQLADSLRAVVSQRLIPRARGTGRVPAVEILHVNHSVASQIREGRTPQIMTALQSGRKEGMLQLERCLADLVQGGQVRLEDARAAANDVESLAGYLRG